MEKLSPEIVRLILDSLKAILGGHDKIASYSTISRAWQDAVEARTMTSIWAASHELADFKVIFSQPHRRYSLRKIGLKIDVPTYGDTAANREKNLSASEEAIVTLLEELQSWEKEIPAINGSSNSIELTMRWRHHIRSEDEKLTSFDLDSAVPYYFDFSDTRLSKFPAVNRIASLKTLATFNLAPHPKALCELAKHLPRLENLSFTLWDPSVQQPKLRLEHRSDLANGLLRLREQLPHLTHLKIVRQNRQDPSNHSFDCQDLIDGEDVDKLSVALRKLGAAGKLTHLELDHIPICSDLFCDRHIMGDEDQAVFTPWPSLQFLRIHSNLVASNGEWLYTGDSEAEPQTPSSEYSDNESEDESEHDGVEGESEGKDGNAVSRGRLREQDPELIHPWRTDPDDETLNPIVEDMTRAITQRMPRLKQFCFDIKPGVRRDGLVVIQAAEAGLDFIIDMDEDVHAQKEDVGLRRFKAWVEADWTVPSVIKSTAEEWVGYNGVVKVVGSNSSS